MVELVSLPTLLGMTALAFFAKLALMAFFLVILAMASHALHRQVLFVQWFRRQMAGIAFHLLVLVAKHIFGFLVVIEMYFLPAAVVMAGFAFLSIASLVALGLVILAMAGITLF